MVTKTGGPGDDIISGTPDADILDGRAGNDRISGGAGNDSEIGNEGDDVLRGGAGNDHLIGDDLRDQSLDASGRDQLLGGDGNDFILGGKGVDVLIGGAGVDDFRFMQDARSGSAADPVYDSGVGAGNRDRIIDFKSGTDRIDLAMDANPLGGDGFDRFNFVGKVDPGQALFAGQLGWFESNGATIVTANTHAAPGSTFQIQLDGIGLGLKASDFGL
jgi:Ca2+-binding RTX toxin-like protein